MKRAQGGVPGRKPKITAEQKKEIVEAVSCGRKTPAEIARLLKLHRATVSRIVSQRASGSEPPLGQNATMAPELNDRDGGKRTLLGPAATSARTGLVSNHASLCDFGKRCGRGQATIMAGSQDRGSVLFCPPLVFGRDRWEDKQCGDPSGRRSTRAALTLHEIVRLLFSFFNELQLQGI